MSTSYLYIIDIWSSIYIYNPRIYRHCIFTDCKKENARVSPRSPEPPETIPRTRVQEFICCRVSSSPKHIPQFPAGILRRVPSPRRRRPDRPGGSCPIQLAELVWIRTKCSQSIPKNPKVTQKPQTKQLSTSFLLAPTITELPPGPPNIRSTSSLKKFCANEKPPVLDVPAHGPSGAAPFNPGQTPQVPEPRDPKPDSKILF